MTHSEMECCKKMAGDCHMGSGQHPCCKTVSNAPTPVASLQPISQVHPSRSWLKLSLSKPNPYSNESQSKYISVYPLLPRLVET
jgi:hypothetical protein